MTVLLTCFFSLLIPGDSFARILRVPENFETIQSAIDTGGGRDTIVVSPGTYFENLRISDTPLTLASLFLLTGNEEYIDSTIIDGDENGLSVISIRDSEDRDCRICGFTITNGHSDYGGGIYVRSSAPQLENLIIRNNTAQRNGAGIYNTGESQTSISDITLENNTANNGGGGVSVYQLSAVSISNCQIRSNHAESYGGGIQCSNALANVENVIIEDNTSGQYGGGIHVFGLASVRLTGGIIKGNQAILGGGIGIWNESLVTATYVLFAENSATFGGAVWVELGSMMASNSTFSNNSGEDSGVITISGPSQVLFDSSILWNNSQPALITVAAEGSVVDVNYSDIENGRDSFIFQGGEFHWGDGNFSIDPLFMELGNVEYHLHEDSPCIDTGNPEAPQDEDGSRSDMGAFPFFNGGSLEGHVFSALDDSPIEDARVSTSNGIITVSDEEGFWQIDNARAANLSITASASGFTDSTEIDIEIEPDEVLQIDFSLRQLEFTPLLEREVLEVDRNNSRVFLFNAGRNGNGVLEWNMDHRLSGEAAVDIWERSRTFPFGHQVDNCSIKAVAFANEMFFIPSSDSNGVENINVFDRDGELINEFDYEGNPDNGITDLTWDGELLWGSGERTIFGYSLDGELIRSFDGPFNVNQAITWDSERGSFWIGLNREDFIRVDPEGEIISDLHNPGFEVTGLSYWDEAPDDFNLYITHHAGINRTVHKMNPTTGDTAYVSSIVSPEGGDCGGSFISTDFYPLATVFMNAFHSTGEDDGDRIDLFLMDAYLDWITYDPSEGVLNQNDLLQVNLTLDSEELQIDNYEAEIIISHNGANSPVLVPIDVTVTHPMSAKSETEITPELFNLSAPYPNPFNCQTTINYFIGKPSPASIKIFNMEGRVIETPIDKWHTPGSHEIVFKTGSISSGVYFVKLSAGEITQTRKMILIR